MIRICPNCLEEAEFNHNICMECGEEYIPVKKKTKMDEWEEEGELEESDWGEETSEEEPIEGGDE